MDIKRQPPFWIVLILLLRYILKRFQRLIAGPPKYDEIDAHGKVVVITGANSGLGKITASEMARRGATVILACRNLDLGRKAAEKIKSSTGNQKVNVVELDLLKFLSIRKFCSEIDKKFPKIDILINNAGIFDTSESIEYTESGFEKHFAVNHVGHFLLTNLLLPNLKRATHSRVVTIGSTADFIEELRLDDLNFRSQNGRSGYGYLMGRIFGKAYAASKFANGLFSAELGKRLKGSGVNTYVLCPGMVEGTELFKYDSVVDKAICTIVLKLVGISATEGAETILYCALSKKCESETGLYYQFCQLHPYENYRILKNRDLAKKLWEESERLVELK